ncbi:hypothetical protein [Melittangium boletus]|uniref:Uncharacterized protein n=1 Tax=Melittangium boletus DSM 14713 TaxID=1294270 RepID=A0A250IJI3_9BACT|nr:hypothetical protein [Melittangium boletus]ATB31352.1 hypothetical protein MEBOL_004814 [Melittangium boletus DSM 14713]
MRGATHTSKPRQPKKSVIEQRARMEPPAQVRLLPVGLRELSEGHWQFLFPARPPIPALEMLSLEDVRPLLAAFTSLGPQPIPRLHLLEVPGSSNAGPGTASRWETPLRERFLSHFGPPPRPLPESLATEPLFSKAFAATLTLRLALAVGLVELGQVALSGLRLYQEAEAASTPQELEAASARFGKSMGGTSLRVLVTVASLGLAKFIPQVPEGGMGRLLPSVTHEGLVLVEQSVSTAQIVADGTLIVSGVAAGTTTCSSLALCATNASGGASSRAPKLSTRHGKPHTQENPTHNEAIERDMASREVAGHTSLRKDRVQRNAAGRRVYDETPVKEIRFRRPDASSVRPDGVRHNTNYVSNPRELNREMEAFESMKRADPEAIHELYLLDGTLVQRYVPPGIGFP